LLKAEKVQGLATFMMCLLFLFNGIDLIYAQDVNYPTKPITCLYPIWGGGNTDLAARVLMEAHLSILDKSLFS